ncbi:hypothetical protein CASFOL_008439 [Castilleja foliolosa]|uniref:Bifunctional inhibitor/plant lipid transfer protein/seed storage helical domain-containing protein n=1 Tax=Castilleja foliolosa TaxID=1961234 RepID=A0ABD3E312_9LAMI
MAKLAAFIAIIAALIALSTATTYTTTTTIVTEINPEQSCQTEIQKMPLTNCKKYLAILSRSYEPSFLRSEVANPGQYTEQYLEECCNEMKRVSSPCRGDAVRRVMMEMRAMWGKEEMQEMMMKKARTIPQKCDLRRSPQNA